MDKTQVKYPDQLKNLAVSQAFLIFNLKCQPAGHYFSGVEDDYIITMTIDDQIR